MASVDIYQMTTKDTNHKVAPVTIFDAVVNPLNKKTLDQEFEDMVGAVDESVAVDDADATLVTTALRKTEQVLTLEEKKQVRTNINAADADDLIQLSEIVSENKTNTDARLSELGSEVGSVDLLKEQEYDCSLGGSKVWYNDTSVNSKHKAVKVTPNYDKITILSSTTSIIGFVTDEYRNPYKNNDKVPYVDGTDRIIIQKNTNTTIDIPEGTAYIIFVTRDGSGVDVVYDYINIKTKNSLLTSIDELEKNVDVLRYDFFGASNVEDVDLSVVTEHKYTLGSSSWYNNSDLGSKHKAVKVGLGYSKVELMCKNGAYVGFVTDAYKQPSISEKIPYVEGTDRVFLGADETHELNIPDGSSFIILSTQDGAGIVIEWESVKLIPYENIRKKTEKISDDMSNIYTIFKGGDNSKGVDVPKLQESDCALGKYGWFNDSSIGCKHKVVKITTEYDKVVVLSDIFVYVGFVTDAYKPPYKNNDKVPYVNNTNRIGVPANTATELKIPYGTSFLILTTVDGGGNRAVYNEVTLLPSESIVKKIEDISTKVEYCESKIVALGEMAQNQPKGAFGIMCYNVGGWYNGTGASIPSDLSDLYLPIQKGILERYNSDIILIQEYRDSVVSDGIAAETLLNGYNLYNTSGSTSYSGKAIAAKNKVTDMSVGIFTNNDSLNRNYLKGYTYCNGRKVAVISTHLSTNVSIASLQIDEIIELIKGEPYVVLGMDSNINVLSEDGAAIMNKIADAGLHFINKDVVTYPKSSLGIDNIVISNNIIARSVYADTQKSVLGDDADHYPLLAYLEIF